MVDVTQKNFDLRNPKFKALEEELARITRELEHVKAEERAEAKAQILHLIETFEFTGFELGLIKTQQIPAKKAKKSEKTFGAKTIPIKQAIPPKYRDPETGKTWSGRGHQPGWMTGNRDDYLIDKSQAATEEAE
jgi:DNA-binding protein H-NS